MMIRIPSVSVLLLPAVLLVPTAAEALLPVAVPTGAVAIHHVQASPRVVVLNASEVHNQLVATGSDERLQVLFADGTTISLAPDSEVAINSFVFESGTGRARLSASVARGVFRFIGGATSRTPDGLTVATPFGILMVDRAVADISLGGDGTPPHFALVSGNAITLLQDGAEVARARVPGYSIVPGANGASVRKTPSEWRTAVLNRLS